VTSRRSAAASRADSVGADGFCARALTSTCATWHRHIDCAAAYGNQEDVGKGLKQAMDEKLCTREDLWITSKLWNSDHGNVKGAIDKTLKVWTGLDSTRDVACSAHTNCCHRRRMLTREVVQLYCSNSVSLISPVTVGSPATGAGPELPERIHHSLAPHRQRRQQRGPLHPGTAARRTPYLYMCLSPVLCTWWRMLGCVQSGACLATGTDYTGILGRIHGGRWRRFTMLAWLRPSASPTSGAHHMPLPACTVSLTCVDGGLSTSMVLLMTVIATMLRDLAVAVAIMAPEQLVPCRTRIAVAACIDQRRPVRFDTVPCAQREEDGRAAVLRARQAGGEPDRVPPLLAQREDHRLLQVECALPCCLYGILCHMATTRLLNIPD